MPRITYNKAALNVAEQLTFLKKKGLLITDHASATNWLSHIGYFRFKHYSLGFKDVITGKYNDGTEFDMVKDLYCFDRKLRMLIFEALENIEVAVKTQLTNRMAANFGPHWYTNPGLFLSENDRRQLMRNAKNATDIPRSLDHASFLKGIEDFMTNADEPLFQNYKSTYEPLHPPSWMMVEIITFGTLSRLYDNLQPSVEKATIHDHFQLTKNLFVSWLHCFSCIRNKCAHHEKIVYTKINFAPSLPQKRSRQFLDDADLVNNASLYAVLCCIQFMLDICNTNSLFKQHLITLIDAYPAIDYHRPGFTKNWKKEKLWTV